MSIDYSTSVATGAIFTPENLFVLKGLLGDTVDLHFEGDTLISSITDVWEEFAEGVLPDGFYKRFGFDLIRNSVNGENKEFLAIHLNSKFFYIDLKESEFYPMDISKEFTLNDKEQKAVSKFNEKYIVPFGYEPIEFKTMMWCDVS